jgi:hypothetical protein
MRERGGFRMSGMGAGDLCEGPCSLVGEVGAHMRAIALAHLTWGFRSVCDVL